MKSIRDMAYWLAYEFHHCQLMGHDYWPVECVPGEAWKCRCGAVSEQNAYEPPTLPQKIALDIAHGPHCWLVGHEWFIGCCHYQQYEDHWTCRQCHKTKPYEEQKL
jgi:hypothetical protein